MQPIEGKKRVALMAAVATLLVLADIFFVIIPLFGKVADLRGKVISRQEAIRSLREQIERIGKTKKTRDGLKQEQMFYYRRFPTEEEIPLLLNNLSVVAASSNVDIIALRPVKADIAAPTTKTAPYREVPLEIVAKGGYHHIGFFINKLEMLDRFMAVKDIEISQDEGGSRKHTVRLLVLTYILNG